MLVLTMVLSAGCGPAPGGDPPGTGQTGPVSASSSPASVPAAIAGRLTGERPAPVSPPDTGHLDRHGPEHAAATLIIDGLAAEKLLVTSLDTELVTNSSRHATVAVTVAHSPGHGHPTQSRYAIELTRTANGWTATGHREQR